jgi:hypothetical protein
MEVIQPLDVAVFNSYKAAYRRSSTDNTLSEILLEGLNSATQNRCNMIGKSLIAYNSAVTAGRQYETRII